MSTCKSHLSARTHISNHKQNQKKKRIKERSVHVAFILQCGFLDSHFGESSKEHLTVKLFLNVYQTTSSEFLVAETDFFKVI